MSDPIIVEGENVENDALRAAVKSYKEAMLKANQELDVSFLLKALQSVNDRSAVKIACNPVDSNHEWVHGTTLYNVGRIDIDEENHLTIHIRRDGGEMTVDKMLDQIEKLKKKIGHAMGPIMLAINDEKKVKITDLYSHSLVKDMYAGVPFDVVLGYFDDSKK